MTKPYPIPEPLRRTSAPPDVERLLRLAADGPGVPETIESNLRNALAADHPPIVQARVAGRLALMLRRAGRESEGVRLLEETLDRFRGDASDADALLRTSLAAAYAARGRDIEALILARCACAKLERSHRLGDLLRARTVMYGVLVLIRAWPLTEVERFALDALVEAAPDDARDSAEARIARFDAERAAGLGEHYEALAHLDRWKKLIGARAQTPGAIRFDACLRGRVLADMGNSAEAIAQLGIAADPDVPTSRTRWHATILRARVRAITGDRDGALADARAALGGLGAVSDELGTDVVREESAALGDVLLNELHQPELARQAMHLAAAALLARCREIETAWRTMPELRDATSSDIKFLNQCRAHAERACKANLELVALAFERAAREGGSDLFTILGRGDQVARLCAWCSRIRTPDGVWLPLADYLPPTPDATHGICESCMARMESPQASQS